MGSALGSKDAKAVGKCYRLIFLSFESLFFVLFLLCDLLGRTFLFSSTVWKFSVIILAFLYVAFEWLWFGRGDALFRRRFFLLLAMGFTLISDAFLLVRGDNYTIGVCTFIAAQIFHALEIPRSKRQAVVSVALRTSIPLLAIAILAFCNILTPLYAAVACYAPQLLGNLLEHLLGAVKNEDREEKRRSLLLTIGFALFLACDLCVGLSNVGARGVGFWIWFFYAPSQALIAISCGRLTHETESC